MAKHQSIDITELAVPGEQLPQLGAVGIPAHAGVRQGSTGSIK